MKSAAFRLLIILGLLILIIIFGSIGFMILEDLSFGNALYFTIATVTTVGYGDIYPATAGGKILAVFMIVTGVGMFLALVAEGAGLLLRRSQEQLRRDQINMMVGVFYSELGTQLLQIFSAHDPNLIPVRYDLLQNQDWRPNNFTTLGKKLEKHTYDLSIGKEELRELRKFLTDRSGLLVQFLGSPNLVEHGSFAQLLLAVLHLKEELALRSETMDLPDTDIKHLVNDALRAYRLLSQQWIEHMQFLQVSYPYLFSLALRTNPFDQKATPIIT